MKSLRAALVAGLAVLFIFTGAAYAQEHQRMSCEDRFDSMDTNHDGHLTLEEFMAAPHHKGNPEKRFKAMDVNGHGYLTKEEFCANRGKGRHSN